MQGKFGLNKWLFDIKNGVLFFPDYSSSLCNNTTNKNNNLLLLLLLLTSKY